VTVQPNPTPEERNVARSLLGLVAIAVGVALCIHGGASMLIPAAYLVALMPLRRIPSTRGYLLILSGSLVVAIGVGSAYAVVAHKATPDAVLIACGLIFIAVGWLRGPGSNRATA
jgi:hypothetical protein